MNKQEFQPGMKKTNLDSVRTTLKMIQRTMTLKTTRTTIKNYIKAVNWIIPKKGGKHPNVVIRDVSPAAIAEAACYIYPLIEDDRKKDSSGKDLEEDEDEKEGYTATSTLHDLWKSDQHPCKCHKKKKTFTRLEEDSTHVQGNIVMKIIILEYVFDGYSVLTKISSLSFLNFPAWKLEEEE